MQEKKTSAGAGAPAAKETGPAAAQPTAVGAAGGGAAAAKATPAPTLDEVLKGGARLKEGMAGPAVKEVQKLLGISTDATTG